MKDQIQKSDRPFNQILRRVWGDEPSFFEEDSRWPFSRGHAHSVSLSEDDQKVYIDAALPGLDENEIEVTLEKGIVWIRGEKSEVEDRKKYYCKAQKSYSYQIALPDSVDQSLEPDARYEKGMVHITFNKAKGEKAKRIQIKTT